MAFPNGLLNPVVFPVGFDNPSDAVPVLFVISFLVFHTTYLSMCDFYSVRSRGIILGNRKDYLQLELNGLIRHGCIV